MTKLSLWFLGAVTAVAATVAWAVGEHFEPDSSAKKSPETSVLTPAGSEIGSAKDACCLPLKKLELYLPETKKKNGLPKSSDMLQAAQDLRRISTGDLCQPDFQPEQLSEYQFKENYVAASIQFAGKRGISPKQTEQIILGVYAIEGGGRIKYDTQAGKTEHPLSTAVGYNQIIFATNLHLIHDDGGTVVAMLMAISQNAGRDRVVELQGKADLYESLQRKLNDELMRFANRDLRRLASYFFPSGKPSEKLYKDFAQSLEPTDYGISGRQFTSALHALLLDGDIGPILQARQLAQDIDQGLGPEFQSYLKARNVARAKRIAAFDKLTPNQQKRAIDRLLANAAYKRLSELEKALLQEKVQKLVAAESFNLLDKPNEKGQTVQTEPKETPKAMPATPLPAKPSGNEPKPLEPLPEKHPADEIAKQLEKPSAEPSELPKKVTDENKLWHSIVHTLEQSPVLGDLLAKLETQFSGNESRDEELAPAAAETCNLLGEDVCKKLFQHPQTPTRQFVTRAAYGLNGVLRNTNAEKLMKRLLLQMSQKRGPGTVEFQRIFDQLPK